MSLDIADGEFVVLLGPSGCGKTTLLRMLAGLPDGGTTATGGRDVTHLPAHRRNLSMVFQSYAVFPHRKPAQLSGGQRQRVAVARAIVVDADVLLMDEPLSNLDALLRLEFRTELKKIVQDLGTTTVYVTHDQSEALSLGDRVAVMRKGRIVQLGDPLAVYDTPADRFVGGFLGSPPMNFLPAKVGPAGDVLHVADAAVAAPAQLAGYGGRDVLLGVRAENIGIATAAGDPAGDATVPSRLEVLEPTGSAVLLTVSVGDQELKVSAPVTFRARPGDTVRLRFTPETLRPYDADTHLLLEN